MPTIIIAPISRRRSGKIINEAELTLPGAYTELGKPRVWWKV